MKPDFYDNPQTALTTHRQRICTNERYKNFCQTHPTAGDIDQFLTWKNVSENVGERPVSEISANPTNPTNHDEDNTCINNNNFWQNYCNLNQSSFENTFKYIFNKFKKGIYIRILNGKLDKFLPFSNINYRNNINFDKLHLPNFQNISDCISYIYSDTSYKPQKIHDDYSCWVFNNGIVRFEYPVSEGDSGCVQMRDMFRELCETRKNLPDMEFFVNRRDFPLLRKDFTEPYTYLFPPQTKIEKEYINDSYLPILSMNGNDEYADVLIPTWDDWSRVRSVEDGKFFVKGARDYRYSLNTDYDSKKDIFVFRGASTGLEVNDKNPRIATVLFAKSHPNLPIDAGITKWNMRPRMKWENEKLYFDTFSKNLKSRVGTVSELSPEEQSNYKYILSIPGHSFAYRFSLELSFNSTILLVKGNYNIWYISQLKEWEHYIPVNSDLSNLEECVTWCLENKEKCKQIAKNAYDFYHKYLSKNAILDYLESMLIKLKKFNGNYDLFPKTKLTKQLEYYNDFFENTKSNKMENKSSLDESYNKIKDNVFRTIYENGNNVCKKINESNQRIKAEFFHEIYFYENIIKTDLNHCKLLKYTNDEAYYTKLEGISLLDYLNLPTFSFETFVKILYKISENLYRFQKKCSGYFMHNDLYPWNIIISGVDTDSDISKLNTNIIDFGKSVYLSKDRLFTLEKDKISSIHDIVSILVSSLSIIMSKYIPHDKTYYIHKLFSFVNNTGYTKSKRLTNLKHIKQFVNHAKKYDVMNYSYKHELEELTPLDFCKFLISTFSSLNIRSLPEKINLRFNFNKSKFDEFISKNSNYKQLLELDKFEENIKIKDFEINDFEINNFENLNLSKKYKNYIICKWFEVFNFGDITLEEIFEKYINLKTHIFYSQ
jgi:hypothetical protein